MEYTDAILNALAKPVLVVDKTLRTVAANPAACETLRVAPHEIKGEPLERVIGLEGGQSWLQLLLADVLKGQGIIDNLELHCTLPPDSRKIFALTARNLDLGDPDGALAVAELVDITDRKADERGAQDLNAALKQHGIDLEGINEELESFSHSVSHDLRTPLRFTNKIAHMLLDQYGATLPADAAKMLGMIIDSTDEMGHLIEDLLEFSQVNRVPLTKVHVDMERLAHKVVEDLHPSLDDRNVRFQIAALPACEADRALMKQVLLNLVGNALKFTRAYDPAEISIGFEPSSSGVEYFVRDNGIGFDMKSSETIFLPFRRLRRSDEYEGSGIGLALARRIVDRHGGRIWTESSEGAGAIFFFTLGLQSVEPSPLPGRTETT